MSKHLTQALGQNTQHWLIFNPAFFRLQVNFPYTVKIWFAKGLTCIKFNFTILLWNIVKFMVLASTICELPYTLQYKDIPQSSTYI